MIRKIFIINCLAIVIYAVTMLSLGIYWTGDNRYDVEIAFDQMIDEIQLHLADGMSDQALNELATWRHIFSDCGYLFILDSDCTVLSTNQECAEYVGRQFPEIRKLVEKQEESPALTVKTELMGVSYFVRYFEARGKTIVLGIEEPDAMWWRNHNLLWSSIALFIIMVIAVVLLCRQVRMSDQLRNHIMLEKQKAVEELQTAAAIQSSVLPNLFPPFPSVTEYDLYAQMNPAREVGGDFYDFFQLPDGRLAFLVADVSGKGIPAALFMMNAKAAIKTMISSAGSPAEAMMNVNCLLCDNNDRKMFVTAWIGVLDPRTGFVEYVNAGHNPPLVCHEGQVAYLKKKHGVVLAVRRNAVYHAETLKLAPGDRMVLYTDGVTEAHNAVGKLLGEDRFMEIVVNLHKESLHAICAKIKQAVDGFAAGREQFDDVTTLVLEYHGAAKA